MKKEETIRRYGIEAYTKQLEQMQAYQKKHQDEIKAYRKKQREKEPEKAITTNHESHRKGGKYYEHALEYNSTGIQGERNKIRLKHRGQWRPYKQLIAPDSQIHHEWVPNTAEYTGVALVEADAHQYGIVDVIEILDGKITLLTEAEIRKRGKKNE